MKHVAKYAAVAAKHQPDMVLVGHGQKEQPLTECLRKTAQLPCLVAGAGGDHDLHSVTKVGGSPMITPVAFNNRSVETVMLERCLRRPPPLPATSGHAELERCKALDDETALRVLRRANPNERLLRVRRAQTPLRA